MSLPSVSPSDAVINSIVSHIPVYLAGNVSITSDIGVDFNNLSVKTNAIISASGLNIKNDNGDGCVTIGSTGQIQTIMGYDDYDIAYLPVDSETGVEIDPTFENSMTHNTVTTQEYVDNQVWKQTKRINALNMISDVQVNANNAVWADACQPLPIPATYAESNFKLDGWYFENLTLGEKINWYIPVPAGLKLKDFKQLYLSLYAKSTTSMPWITIYTKVKTDNNKSTWYNSRINLLMTSEVTKPNDTNYLLTVPGFELYGTNLTLRPHKDVSYMAPDIIQVPGYIEPNTTKISDSITLDDEISLLAISTDSIASPGNVNFVMKQLGLVQQTSVIHYKLSNDSVASNYLFNSFYNTNMDFTPINSSGAATGTQSNHLVSYNSTYGTAKTTTA